VGTVKGGNLGEIGRKVWIELLGNVEDVTNATDPLGDLRSLVGMDRTGKRR
jgi:hypothetical protein